MNIGRARFGVVALSVLILGGLLQPQGVDAAAGTGDQAVTYLQDVSHDGTVSGDTLAPPLTKQWSRTDLGGTVSYPLIAGGKVFVTVQGPYGTGSTPPKWIYALDENTGATIWSKPESGTYGFLSAAYDNGSVYLLNYDGLLQSFDAATGTVNWSITLTGQYAFDSAPTAANGVVWVLGSGNGGTLYAIRESAGSVLWQSPNLDTGSNSAPTLSPSGAVFVSQACDVYAFSAAATNLGQPLWANYYGCSGGAAKNSVLGPKGLYVRNMGLSGSDLILDPTSGKQVGSFSSGPPPSFSGSTAFVVNGGKLTATDSSGNTVWTFSGDGGLCTQPLVINNDVYIGSSSGMLYAVDTATGQSVWSGNTGGAFQSVDVNNSNMISSLGAGEGHLLAPTGSGLTAYVAGPVDTTPPVISYNVKGPQGNNGWYIGSTAVTWSVTDPESGIASSSGCGTTTLTTDTSGTALTCSATNGVGLSASSTVTVKLDATPPALNCVAPPSGWSASDISITCTPTDSTSGVSTADGYFTLATSVASGTETSSASTPSRTVCDLAGNCATAGPFTGLKVDKKAPSITLSAPVAQNYTLKQTVAASYSCADGGSGVASCLGPVALGASIDTNSVGSKTFTVNAADGVGNAATPSSVSYFVMYGVCQSTIPVIKAGRTGSVTVNLCDASGVNVSSSAITVTAANIYTSSGTFVRSVTNNFSYKSGGGYTESISAGGLATGNYYVAFKATNDPVTHQAAFSVK